MNDTRRKILDSIIFWGKTNPEFGSVKLVPVTSTEPLYTFPSKTPHSNGAFVNDRGFKLLKCFVTTTTTNLVFYPT